MVQEAASAPALRHAPSDRDGTNRAEPQAQRREPSRHTYGAIDLGTNNCRLLIARPGDQGITVIDAFSRIVRLGEGLTQTGRLSRRGDGPGGRRARGVRRQAAPPQRLAVALGRDRGLPPRRQRPRIRRAGARRDRHRPRHHRPAGGSAAGGARLPQIARARRRAGADLRHRRRLDRAGAGRPESTASRASAPGGARRGASSR